MVKIPLLINNKERITDLVKQNIEISKEDWDSNEFSWNFKTHPLIQKTNLVSKAFEAWQSKCQEKFDVVKSNERQLNDFFIDLYGLKNEVVSNVNDRDVTIHIAECHKDIKSLISYAVGCMFGRYSLYKDGFVYMGGKWDYNDFKYFASEYYDDLPHPP